jgi:hypothetical protein
MPFERIHTEPMVRVNYHIPTEIKALLEQEAKKRGITPTLVLKGILYDWKNSLK